MVQLKGEEMGKNTKGIGAVAVVAAIVLLGLFAVPGLGMSVFSSLIGWELPCEDAPYNEACTCSGTDVKTSSRSLAFEYFTCVDFTPPAEYSFPLTSFPDVISYAEWTANSLSCTSMGGVMNGIPETGAVWMTDGKYGSTISGTLSTNPDARFLEASCRIGGNEVAYEVDLDPNDGWIYRRICNPTYVSNCPPNIDLNFKF